MKHFPLRLSEELHDLITKAAFVTGKSKHQYCMDAIRKEAEQDAKNVQISNPSQPEKPKNH